MRAGALQALAGALALALAAGPAVASPALWVVRDADSTIVLFGSVHVLPKDVDWEPKALADAIAGADDLWFEIPLDQLSAVDIAQQAARHSLLPPGQKLSDLLDPKSKRRLDRLSRRLQLPIQDLDQLQPWMAEVRLSLAMLQHLGGLNDLGVEQQLDQTAPARIPRRAFETGSQQISTLSGGELSVQLTSLKETLRELDRDPGAYKRMIKAWLSGDAKAIDKEAVAPLRTATPESYKTLVLDRNRAWVDIIAQRLAGSGRTVMVVGAGHLVGPDGVPTLLRQRGIAVDGP